ncbi:MAG: hypothetical protein LBN12_08425 [Clostridiales Family XIII bacterium]|nr:hypothetical protein [Clostridiales Family XIII bacterium]
MPEKNATDIVALSKEFSLDIDDIRNAVVKYFRAPLENAQGGNLLITLEKIKEQRKKGTMIMKELILYYSFGGATRRYAEARAQEDGAELVEIKEVTKRNGFTAWIPGVFQAMGHTKTAIEPIEADLDAYEKIVVAGPIWAGNAAPAVNSAAALLPKTAKIELVLVSGSGTGYGEKLAAAVRANGNEVTEVVNVGAKKN